MDSTQITLAIIAAISTITVAALSRDRKDAKKPPITHDDRIEAGGGDLAYVLTIAKRAEDRAAAAEARAAAAEQTATEAKAEAAEARQSESHLKAIIHSILDWYQILVHDWDELRAQTTPPALPDEARLD